VFYLNILEQYHTYKTKSNFMVATRRRELQFTQADRSHRIPFKQCCSIIHTSSHLFLQQMRTPNYFYSNITTDKINV
jgi:hypothetical protein